VVGDPSGIAGAGPTSAGVASGAQPKIRVEHLSVAYADGTESLRDISLDIPEHQISVLFGPAGGGKSTLLRALNRLNDLVSGVRTTGKIYVDGQEITGPQVDVVALRRKVGIVFAQPVVLPMSIRKNITYGLELAGVRQARRHAEAVEKSLAASALWDEVKDRLDDPAVALSGGQQQRLCLARALALDPSVLLMDEPCSALDPISTQKIEALVQRLAERRTIVLVTHSLGQARRLADQVALFWKLDGGAGRLIEGGDAAAVFAQPRHALTQTYLQFA
jgi:phosphate transport system ATP-binding protein